MLKYHTIDISCRVIPNEVCLVFNITGCTIKCPGCNEKTLWKDKGTPLNFKELRSILDNYNSAVSCVCFMGGEHEPQEINALARTIKINYPCLRTAWYSGLNTISEKVDIINFNYIKTGPYEAHKGALGTPGTNQRVFLIEEDCSMTDITDKYIRTEPDEFRQAQTQPEPAEQPSEEQPTEEQTENIDANLQETESEENISAMTEDVDITEPAEEVEEFPEIPTEGKIIEI